MSALILPTAASHQLELFDSVSESTLYHPEDQRGFFSLLWREGDKKTQWSWPLTEMARVLRHEVDYTQDTWISQGEFFKPNRRVVNLARIGVLFADLDTYKIPALSNLSPDALVQRFHFFCTEQGLVAPSLVVFSGRGLQVKWLLSKPVPSAALPRWNACQRMLIERLETFGSDRQARDASRVLRLVDSHHSISCQRIEVIDYTGINGKPVTYDFDWLADQILPRTREEWAAFVVEDRARKAERKAKKEERAKLVAENPKAEIFRGYNGRTLAWARLNDLRKLGELRGGWVTENGASSRTQALHWQLNFLCLSGAANPCTFHHEARELAKQIDPHWEFKSDELGTLRNKAIDYVSGKTIEFGGREWPALYTPKNQTLIDLFGISDAEQRQMKTIITPALATERDTIRQREKRRAAGVVERSEYLGGIKDRQAEIRALKADGVAVAEIARRLGVTRPTVYAALKTDV